MIIRANIIQTGIRIMEDGTEIPLLGVEGIECERFRVVYAGANMVPYLEVDDGVEIGEREIAVEEDIILVRTRKMWREHPLTEPDWIEVER